MHKKSLVIKSSAKSGQTLLREDTLSSSDGIVEPYLDYPSLRLLYAYNIYHQRAIKIKAALLSQIDGSAFEGLLSEGMNAKRFLYKFLLNAETYGSAFFERAGTESNATLYNLGTYNARVDTEGVIYQYNGVESLALEGGHMLYDTILSDHYGEPDYIAVISQILTTHKADLYNGTFFDNGARPEMAIIFEDSDPSDEQIDAISTFFKRDFRGYGNAHKNLILTTGEGDGQTKPKIRIEDFGGEKDMSFKGLKDISRDEIIAAHGVPPRLVGVAEASRLGGGNELISQLHMFNETTLRPKMELIEAFFAQQHITLKLKEFDTTAFKDDAELVTGLVQSGILSALEAKNIIGL